MSLGGTYFQRKFCAKDPGQIDLCSGLQNLGELFVGLLFLPVISASIFVTF